MEEHFQVYISLEQLYIQKIMPGHCPDVSLNSKTERPVQEWRE